MARRKKGVFVWKGDNWDEAVKWLTPTGLLGHVVRIGDQLTVFSKSGVAFIVNPKTKLTIKDGELVVLVEDVPVAEGEEG